MQAVLSALTYLLLAILLPPPASADDWTGCKAGALSVQIAACSRIIGKGAANPALLANAYRFRASAYARAKDQVKAVEDLNQAIRATQPTPLTIAASFITATTIRTGQSASSMTRSSPIRKFRDLQ